MPPADFTLTMQARADRICQRAERDAKPEFDWLSFGFLALAVTAHVGALAVMYVMARAL